MNFNYPKNKNLYLFFAGLILLVIQIIPIKLDYLGFLSPRSHYYYQNISENNIWFISLNPINTLKYISIYISCYLIFLITPNLIKNISSLNKTFSIIMWLGLIHAIYGLLMYFLQLNEFFFYEKISNIDSVTGFFINRNNFSLFLILILIILVNYLSFYKKYYIDNNEKSYFRYIFSDISLIRMSILIIGITIILTKSRIGNISFISFLLFSLFLEIYIKKKFTFLSKIIITMIIADIMIISSLLGLENLFQRFTSTNLEKELIRSEIFLFGIKRFQDFMIYGYGLGNFETIFRLEFSNFNLLYDHIHNDFIEYLGELGIFLSIYFIYIFFKFFKNLINFKNQITLKKIIFGVILISFIHGNFDFALHMPAIIIFISFVFSLSLCVFEKNKK